MINVYNTEQVQQMDKATITEYISSNLLMSMVATKTVSALTPYMHKGLTILFVVGPGGNGGDGFAIASLLFMSGYKVCVYKVKDSRREDTKAEEKRFLDLGGILLDKLPSFKIDIIFDCIFGVGLHSQVSKEILEVFDFINNSGCSVASIDMPSGINSDTGLPMGGAVKCDILVGVQNHKLGYFLNAARDYYKRLILIDIGIKKLEFNNVKILEKSDYKGFFKKRLSMSNKGDYKRVGLIGGSTEYIGASMLCFNSLLPLIFGSGYSMMIVPKSLYRIYAAKNLETIYRLMPDIDGHMQFDETVLKPLLKLNVITIGMGLGTSEEIYKIVKYLVDNFEGTLILDADAINSLSMYGPSILSNHKCQTLVLTPHVKEFSRLIDASVEDVLNNPIVLAQEFAKKYNVSLILKSNFSVITNGEETLLNVNGNPALAKGGSGDILSGILTGLFTKGQDPLKTCALASFILGDIAELSVLKYNENCILGSKMVKEISKTITELTE